MPQPQSAPSTPTFLPLIQSKTVTIAIHVTWPIVLIMGIVLVFCCCRWGPPCARRRAKDDDKVAESKASTPRSQQSHRSDSSDGKDKDRELTTAGAHDADAPAVAEPQVSIVIDERSESSSSSSYRANHARNQPMLPNTPQTPSYDDVYFGRDSARSIEGAPPLPDTPVSYTTIVAETDQPATQKDPEGSVQPTAPPPNPKPMLVALTTLRGSFALSSSPPWLRGSGCRASNRKLKTDPSEHDDYVDEHRLATPTITTPHREHRRAAPNVAIDSSSEAATRPRTKCLPGRSSGGPARKFSRRGRQLARLTDVLQRGQDTYRSDPNAPPLHTHVTAGHASRAAASTATVAASGHSMANRRHSRVRRNHRNESMASGRIPPHVEEWWQGRASLTAPLTQILGGLRRSLLMTSQV